MHRPFTEPRLAKHPRQWAERLPGAGEITRRKLEMAERPEMVCEPDRRLDRPGVLDAGFQCASGFLDTSEMHHDEAARVPLVAELAAQLAVEVNELGRIGLGSCEVA